MRILQEATYFEMMIKNSRFVAEALPVASAEEARAVLAAQRARYADANHVVYAFIVGLQGEVLGCSDAGEPSGTAGRPTLAVVKGSGMTNFLLTTARWFGGTKLGTGGLVHGYTACAQGALENAVSEEWVAKTTFALELPYDLYDRVKRLFAETEVEVLEEAFTDVIAMRCVVREEAFAGLDADVGEMSKGKVALER